jgi:hypothetical protein
MDELEYFDVLTPAGSTFTVLGERERDLYEQLAVKYQDSLKFSNITDLQDLDRVIAMELLSWRWQMWVSQDQDYMGNSVDVEALKKSITETSRELRLLKKSMGMDKASRNREASDSISDYVETLKVRAKEFGLMREEQLTKTLTLFHELAALMTLYHNCTPDERREQNCEQDDIFEWLTQIAVPEFEKVDEYFRQNTQKYWRKDQ